MGQEAVTITLDEPVEFAGETITQLVVQPPKGKHLRKMPTEMKVVGDMIALADKLTGQPREVIDEMCVGDTMRLVEAVSSFFPDPPEDSGD